MLELTLQALNVLYPSILAEAVKDDDGDITSEYALRLHDILEIVIFAREPITLQTLAHLLDMDRDDLVDYLSPLLCVLDVPGPADEVGVIKPLQQSFLDFVVMQGGLVHDKLGMHMTVAEMNMAELCILFLNTHLHFSSLVIQKQPSPDLNAPERAVSQVGSVSPALQYSGKFWPIHLLAHIRAAGPHYQIPASLYTFCAEHVDNWIELLSLTGDLEEVERVLSEAIEAINVGSSLCPTSSAT
jgi:hypothetical protein